MASPFLAIVQAIRLPGAVTLLYASPLAMWTRILSLSCQNTDVRSRGVTFYLVPRGASAGAPNIVTNAQPVLAGQTWNDPYVYAKVLNPGDALWGVCDVGGVVNVFASAAQSAG